MRQRRDFHENFFAREFIDQRFGQWLCEGDG